MTVTEARRAYSEMVPKIGPEHASEVREMLDQVEARGLERAPDSTET